MEQMELVPAGRPIVNTMTQLYDIAKPASADSTKIVLAELAPGEGNEPIIALLMSGMEREEFASWLCEQLDALVQNTPEATEEVY